MKSDDPISAAASRAWQQERIDKRSRRREKQRADKAIRAQQQKRQAELRRRGYVPRIKAKLPEYQPGPVIAIVGVDDFLQSYEWRRVRMEAIKRYGAKCQCCGATPETGAIINVDHIKPRKIFPELALSLDNLQVLCHECNHGKGNWDMTDWRKKTAKA